MLQKTCIERYSNVKTNLWSSFEWLLKTHYDETKKRAHDSQIVRAKEKLKMSHGGPSYRKASGTNPPIKVLRQSHHWVWGMTHRHAIKEETIATTVFFSPSMNVKWIYLPASDSFCPIGMPAHYLSVPNTIVNRQIGILQCFSSMRAWPQVVWYLPPR